MDASAVVGHRRGLLERLHELARAPHPAQIALAEALPAVHTADLPQELPLLLDLGQGRPGVKRADAGQELVVRQLAGIRHVDEDVEVIAHEAIRQHLHAGKRRNAPKSFDEARLLLVIQEERAVGNTADQMAALVGLEVAQRSHGVHYTIISCNPTT